MVVKDRVPVIFDFGLAGLLDDQEDRLTTHERTMGTPAYMAPEGIQGSGVDHRADQWGYAAILCRVACGTVPFDGERIKEIRRGQEMEAVPRNQRNPVNRVTVELEQIITRALRRNPEERYASMDELTRELAACTHWFTDLNAPISSRETAEKSDTDTKRE